MSRSTQLLSPNEYNYAQQCLKELGKNGEQGRRLQAIISVEQHGITQVAKVFNITRSTLTLWIKAFKADSTEGLTIKKGRGRKRLLTVDQEEVIKNMILEQSSITIDELADRIEEGFSIRLGRSTVHRLMKRLRFSYMTPRQRHYKADPQKQEEFKKKYEKEA